MVAVRQWHPVRLALVCAILAMAGGSPGARGSYAEVSATTSVAAHAGARAHAARSASVAVAVASPSRAIVRVAAPVTPRFVVASLYLTHCALLL